MKNKFHLPLLFLSKSFKTTKIEMKTPISENMIINIERPLNIFHQFFLPAHTKIRIIATI